MPSQRGKRNRYDAVAIERRPWYQPTITPNQRNGVYASLAIVFGLWLSWFLYTRPVRGELGRVEAYLEKQSELQLVDFDIPLFSRSFAPSPATVEFTAIGLPPGKFDYEVRVELKGTYDPHTRVAHVYGVKQVLFPYTKVKIDQNYTIPSF